MTILLIDENQSRVKEIQAEFGLTPRILVAETALQAVNIMLEHQNLDIYIGDFVTNGQLVIEQMKKTPPKYLYWL